MHDSSMTSSERLCHPSNKGVFVLCRSLKTVSLTLWGESAEEQGATIEAEDAPVIIVTSCRVTEYNGELGRTSSLLPSWT